MKIVEKNLQFKRTARNRSETNRVIIHHSVSHDVGVETIHQWHLDNGWFGIGYHFCIRENGDIEKGRAEKTVGAHAGASGNADSIGVCLLGNFEVNEPTEAQLNSLAWLITNYLEPKYGELKVQGHNDFMSTACPGSKFPWDELERRIDMSDVPEWKTSAVDFFADKGMLNDPEGWKDKIDDPVPAWAFFIMLERIYKANREGR